jgi:prepilin-type N-terminal cleavage/methylation domain-containing protein
MLSSRRRRSAAAFTLPELMAVIAIVAVMGAIAMATMSRAGDAENAASLARSLQVAIMTARNATLSDGFMRRLNCTLQTDDSTCFVERAATAGMQVASSAAWTTAGGMVRELRVSAGTHATLWNVTPTNDATANNAGSAQFTGNKLMYLKPDGTVCDNYATATTPTTACTSSGFTFYVDDTAGKSTAANQYKIYVYAVTGMPRLVNAW